MPPLKDEYCVQIKYLFWGCVHFNNQLYYYNENELVIGNEFKYDVTPGRSNTKQNLTFAEWKRRDLMTCLQFIWCYPNLPVSNLEFKTAIFGSCLYTIDVRSALIFVVVTKKCLKFHTVSLFVEPMCLDSSVITTKKYVNFWNLNELFEYLLQQELKFPAMFALRIHPPEHSVTIHLMRMPFHQKVNVGPMLNVLVHRNSFFKMALGQFAKKSRIAVRSRTSLPITTTIQNILSPQSVEWNWN